MSNRAESLLARIEDRQLREQLAAELAAARGQRSFGLVFEHHLPETVRLPRVTPRRGLKAVLKADKSEQLLRVLRLSGKGAKRVAECVPVRSDESEPPAESVAHPVSDLEVVAEFGDPVYPGLSKAGEVTGLNTDPSAPSHVVLNAENHHALQALQWSHAGAVDLIYIDPPYNTGNKTWQYNDHYVGEQDSFRHSKWLSFMEKRLILARDLLKDTGVIIVAIDDNEHHRLRMLMDQVFGDDNFLANITWQGNIKNDARFAGEGVDYMLIYAGSRSGLVASERRWMETKPGAKSIFEAAAAAWKNAEGVRDSANVQFRKWWRSLPPGSPELGSKHYSKIDDVKPGEPYFASPLMSPNYRVNLVYDLIHPVTGLPHTTPTNGWRYSRTGMDELIAQGRVHFGKNESVLPNKKVYLREVNEQSVFPSFREDRRSAGSHLKAIFGDKRFPFPKNHEVVMRWIRLAAPKDAVVLDFFGGSGTTAEAVIRLNAEDGGTRQSILVTNNELAAKDDAALRKYGHEPGSAEYESKGVFHHVTKPRIETVVSGLRKDGSTYSEGLPGHVEFFNLEYLDADRIANGRAFDAILPMLWLRAGARGPLKSDADSEDSFIQDNYAILHDASQWRAFAKQISPDITHAFVVTNSASEFSRAARALPAGVEVIRLYEKYLKTFEINTQELRR